MQRKVLPTLALVLALAVALSASTLRAQSSSQEKRQPDRSQADISLPKDDAPHPVQPIEWWYYTGHLFTQSGKRYGVELVFFQFPTPNAPNVGTATTFAVTDLNGSTPVFVNESLVQPAGFPSGDDATGINLSLNAGTRSLSASGRNGSDHLSAQLTGYAVELDLRSLKPAALHGKKGVVSFPSGDDHYYSRTRMDVHGTMTVGTQREAVSGVAWFDHQYGVQPGVSWTWFSIQLNSNEELMLYRWVTPAGDRSSMFATFVSANGKSRSFQPSQLRLTELDTWTSPDTHNTYGRRWHIQIPAERLDLTVTTRLPGSELLPPGQLPYIEADADVVGIHEKQPVAGYGFAEQVFFPQQ